MTLKTLQTQWNRLAPISRELGIPGVKIHTSNFERVTDGAARLNWLKLQLVKKITSM